MWKIQLTIANNFISSKVNDEVQVMQRVIIQRLITYKS